MDIKKQRVGESGGQVVDVNKKLKLELIEKLSNVYDSMPIYSVRKLSSNEMIENAKFYATRFMGKDSSQSFRSIQRETNSTLIKLPWETKLRIYHHSNAIVIRRKINPMQNLIREKIDEGRQVELAVHIMKKLELDKFRLAFEQVKLEDIWHIKASGINFQEERAPTVLCRIVATFRRFINEIPVFGSSCIFLKIAGDNLIEAVGIDWRQIEEQPVEYTKIIKPEIAAEKILESFNSTLPNRSITLDDYMPEFFATGYFSMTPTQQQNYMQPVYVASFKPLGLTTLNIEIVIPATIKNFEPIVAPEEPEPKFLKVGK